MKAKEDKKSNKKKFIFLGLGFGILAIGGFSYWYFVGREKGDTSKDLPNSFEDDTPKTTPKPKTAPKTSASAPTPKQETPTKIIVPSSKDFPIKKGSKKELIKQVQEALMKIYGKSILPAYGADGDFGSETKAALASKGFPTEVDETTYKKLTEESSPSAASNITDADKENIDIAKNIWVSATTKKLTPLLEQLKRIKDVAHYVKVNELFKTIRLGGVRQTIVNGSLSSFSDATSKQFISEALKNIGLKYYDEKWNLSGIDERKIITNQETTICSIAGCAQRVPEQTVLGIELTRGRHNTRFRALNNQILYVPTKHIQYV